MAEEAMARHVPLRSSSKLLRSQGQHGQQQAATLQQTGSQAASMATMANGFMHALLHAAQGGQGRVPIQMLNPRPMPDRTHYTRARCGAWRCVAHQCMYVYMRTL